MSLLLFFLPILRFAPFDFLGSFNGFYDRTNQSRDTWFCQLIDSCARVPVFTHGIAHAPFKLYVITIWMGHLRNLKRRWNNEL